MKNLLYLLALVLTTFSSAAQEPAIVLQKLSDSFPQERIHIHFDKDAYVASETIWFKAYLFSGFVPSNLSSNFYAELLDGNSKVIAKQYLPLLSGTASGQFIIPDSLPGGEYIVRAYTPWMLNFPQDFVFQKKLFIFKTGVAKKAGTGDVQKNFVHFFPEGGDLVQEVVNVVAFKATDEKGLPVNVSGRLLDNDKNEIVSLQSIHDGLGSFGFVPLPGKNYSVEIKFQNGTKEVYSLPDVKPAGWVMQVREESSDKRRVILAKPNNTVNEELLLVGQMQQQLVLQQPIKLQGNNAVISMSTKEFPTGILQLTLMTKTGFPLAERLIFVNNNDYRLNAQLSVDSLSLGKKEKNVISFAIPDSVLGSFSVSVTDMDRVISDSNRDEIISRLLLTSDLKGYVHQPGYYLKNNEKETRMALDLLMMTHGWRRFNWQQVMAGIFPVIQHRDRNHIQISGTIFSDKTKKPVSNGDVNFFLRTKDSLTDFFQASVDDKGRFILENLVYSDTATFSFQLNSKKTKEKELFIRLNTDSIDYLPFANQVPLGEIPTLVQMNDSFELVYSFARDTTGKFKMLDEVIVVAKKKRPVEELNERYTSGLFSSMNMVRILDLVNNNPGAGALHVFQYIQGRIAGIRVVTEGFPPSYTVFTPRAMSLTGGPIPVPLYLDEVPATSQQLQTIPMNQIAMIKFFQTGFMGTPGVGSTQALVVYTKRGPDAIAGVKGYLSAFSYPGYSAVKEFYAPDYIANPELKSFPDRRNTLLWQPELRVDGVSGKYKIRFFNSDYAKRIKVVVEGMTAEGKLLHLEKIITNR